MKIPWGLQTSKSECIGDQKVQDSNIFGTSISSRGDIIDARYIPIGGFISPFFPSENKSFSLA